MKLSIPIDLGISLFFLISVGSGFSQRSAPNIVELTAKARTALASGKYAEAETAFETLKLLEPQVAEINANLGAIYFQEAKYEQAVAALREALRSKPSLSKSESLLALSLAEIGQYDEALRGLEKGFREAADPGFRRLFGLQLLSAYTNLQRDAEAVTIALKLRELYPNDPEILYHTSKIFGNFAYLTMRQLAKVAPNSSWKHLANAETYESEAATESAIAEYRTVLSLEPGHPGIHYRIGRTLLAASQHGARAEYVENALHEFLAELSLDPTNGNAAYEAAEVYHKRNELDAAMKFYDEALANYPEFVEAHQGLAAVLMQQQKPDQALPHLRKAIALEKENQVSWYRLAQAERAIGDVAEQKRALAEFQRLHQAANDQTDYRQVSSREVTQQILEESPAQ